jgi:arsenite methyltransferase
MDEKPRKKEMIDELPFWSAPFGLKLLDKVDYRSGITALDIGFGSGFPLIELAMRLGEDAVVYGIDPWKEAIEITKEKIVQYGISTLRLIDGVAESIPLENGSVDLIVSNNGLNNVNDMEKVVSECSRVLKPGGQFVLTMNLDRTMFEFYSELEKVLAESGMEEEIRKMYRHIYEKRRPLNEILDTLIRHGFSISSQEEERFTYRFSNCTAMFNHYFIRRYFVESWKKILPEDRIDGVFKIVEARLNERSVQSGGITLTIPFVVINAYHNM